jgi:multidrug efflux pump subunit AcrB
VDFLEKELLLVPGVAKINITGEQQETVYVEISRDTIASLGIPLQDIYQVLNTQNFVFSAGEVQVGSEYIRINPTGEFTSVKDMGELLIRSKDSNKFFKLKDIAKIYSGYQEPPSMISRFNGNFAITVGVSVIPGGNVVKMGKALVKRVSELESQRPVGMELNIISDQPTAVEDSVGGFVLNLIEAIVIVIVVLLIFMGLRSGLIIGAVLLVTVCASLIIMDFYHINLQRISLGALIIALGMLVDNAIVVTEGMLIKIQQGIDRLKAAKEIVAQTMWPLLGATIIAVLAFAAIGLSQDSTGEYCGSLFQVLLISLMMSWVTAVTITPLFCYMFLKDTSGDSAQDPYGGVFFRIYKKFLTTCINRRWLTVLILLIMLGFSIYGFTTLKGSFFPPSTRDQFMINVWLPEGSDIRETSKILSSMEKELLKDKRIKNIATFIGRGAPRFMLTYSPEKAYEGYALMLVSVDDFRIIDEMTPELRKLFKEKYPQTQCKVKKFQLGPSPESTIEVRFSGPDPKILRQLSEQAKKILRDDNTVCVKDDWRQMVKNIVPLYSESQARSIGITREELCRALETAFKGEQIGLYRKHDNLLPIVSRAPKEERLTVDNIYDIQVWSNIANKSVPITQIVSGFETVWKNPIINRRNRKRTITAQCDERSGVASEVLKRVMPKIEAIELPSGYEMEWGGEYESSQDAQKALAGNLLPTFILMTLIIVFLFNSLKKPAIIILSVPLAIIGVTVGLMITKQPFGFMSLLGFLSLTGMLIKNSIVLIDEIDLQTSLGKESFDAIIFSALSRARPVSMAAVTTILGMLPLLMDAFFIGMAVTIMAGLAFATILTLVVIPVLYAIFFRVKSST